MERGRARTLVGLLLLALLAGSVTACITVAPRSRPASELAEVVPGVPVRDFGFEKCGPGSLAAALNALGDPVSVEQLDAELPKAAHGGVLSLDLVLAARRHGFDAELVEGTPEAVRGELAAGRAVILMLRVLDAPGTGADYFHYVVADGWDPGGDLVRVQFGDGQARWTSFDRLERPWAPTGHATLFVRPGPPREDATANTLRFAAALEDAGRPAEAVPLYRRLLAERPDSPLLWTDLGNALAADGDRAGAEQAFRRALTADPAAADALDNLAWLLYEEAAAAEPGAPGRLPEAEALARRAVAAGGADPYLALDTLGRILHARGVCAEAAEALTRASAAAPVASAATIDLELGRTLADCGRPEEARSVLERAAAAATDDPTRRQAESSLAAFDAVAGSSGR